MGVSTLLKLVGWGFFLRLTHDYQVLESVITNFKITRLDFCGESRLLIAEEFKIPKIHPHVA